jgi:hypothetical protein
VSIAFRLTCFSVGGVEDRILVNKREAARLLSISVTSLDYLIRQRQVVIRRLGRRTLVSVASLHDYACRDHSHIRAVPDLCLVEKS